MPYKWLKFVCYNAPYLRCMHLRPKHLQQFLQSGLGLPYSCEPSCNYYFWIIRMLQNIQKKPRTQRSGALGVSGGVGKDSQVFRNS